MKAEPASKGISGPCAISESAKEHQSALFSKTNKGLQCTFEQNQHVFETCFDCASGPGLFPAFGAPYSPGAWLFGQTGAPFRNASGGELIKPCLPNALHVMPA